MPCLGVYGPADLTLTFNYGHSRSCERVIPQGQVGQVYHKRGFGACKACKKLATKDDEETSDVLDVSERIGNVLPECSFPSLTPGTRRSII